MRFTQRVTAWNHDMKRINALGLLGLAGIGCLVAVPVFAQDSYYYGGLSLGQSRARIDEDRITRDLLSRGLTTTGFDRDEKSVAFKLFAGYQFNRYFAIEGGYFNLGKFGFTSTTVPAGTLDGEMRVQGLNLDLVGTLPITDRFAALGRVGATYARTRDEFRGSGAIGVPDPNPSKNGAGFKVGLGLQYAFSPSFIVRGEAERYRIDDAVGNKGDINAFMLSLVFPFGRTTRSGAPDRGSGVHAAAGAGHGSVAAAPACRRGTAPRASASRQTPSSASISRTSSRKAGRRSTTSPGNSPTPATTWSMSKGTPIGLGSAAYNQRLSVRRAEAVKNYLVTSGGVSPAKISATGKGLTEPVTKPEDCRGPRTAKLIACLQPDRRVEVEVTGTR
jgi:OOP family OmpA-OmpF porin